jgi:DNA-binding Lrp family transcriptional regulator
VKEKLKSGDVVRLVEAYILLKMCIQREMSGFARSVVEKLSFVDGVEYAELLFGDFDAIVKLKGAKIHDVENLVLEEISMIEGIESTVTLLCVDDKILV